MIRILFTAFFVTILFACGDEASSRIKKVYAVGYSTKNDRDQQATLWVDGKAVMLSDAPESIATDVFVVGDDVYVSGNYENDNSNRVACVWKNGIKTDLGPANKYSYANGIFVTTSGDVYAAGESENDRACYWKNGVLTELSKKSSSTASNIFVSGGDVYVSGYVFIGESGRVACYWKNGVQVNLTDETKDSFGNSVFVAGSDVYVSGTENSVCKFWKNGVPTSLEGSFAKEVKIVDGRVYVAGEKDAKATIWINGDVKTISTSANRTQARDFDVDGETIYAGGNEIIDGVSTARIWKGSEVMSIDFIGQSNINAIAVQ